MRKLPQDIRDDLACPRCRGPLADDATASGDGRGSSATAPQQGFACTACRVIYPVERGMPVLLIDAAHTRVSDRD